MKSLAPGIAGLVLGVLAAIVIRDISFHPPPPSVPPTGFRLAPDGHGGLEIDIDLMVFREDTDGEFIAEHDGVSTKLVLRSAQFAGTTIDWPLSPGQLEELNKTKDRRPCVIKIPVVRASARLYDLEITQTYAFERVKKFLGIPIGKEKGTHGPNTFVMADRG